MSFKELIISGIQNQLSDRSIKRSLKKSFKEIDFSKEIKLIRYELSEEKKLDDALQTILSLDLSWKRKAITEILRKIYCDNETYDPIEYVEANGKVRRWILTPHTNQVRTYADFYKHYPKPSLCSFLLSIGGPETQGLSILAEYFHKRHSSDFDSVCSRLGFTQTKQLSVNETVALQEYSSITHCQRRSIHSILISLLGFSVLSPNHAVEEYKNPYLNEFILSYYNEMPFRYVSIEKALINCLRQLRDTFFLSKIGKDVGILGPVAAYVLHGDTNTSSLFHSILGMRIIIHPLLKLVGMKGLKAMKLSQTPF